MGPVDSGARVIADIRAAADAMGVALSAKAEQRLASFLDLLILWRRRVPLVSQRTASDIVAKHLEDSLAVVDLLADGWSVADLGSGAGFPGVVIGIAAPSVSVLLVESARRKANFLRAVVRDVELKNVRVAETRAENLTAWPDYTGPFDLVVCRAVWKLKEFLAMARPMLRPDGLAVAMKTPTARDIEYAVRTEASLAKADGYSGCEVRPYRLRAGERRVLVVARRCFT